MKNSNTTRTKILEVAKVLFYKNGYCETGLNEILQKSSAYKKSFYIHFSSKQDLGVEYIKTIRTELIFLIQRLLKKHSKFENFTNAWIHLLKKKISKNYFQGCPFANFPVNSETLRKQLQFAFSELKEPFVEYFMNNYGFTKEKSKKISEEILFLYEGALTSYKLDPHFKYFDYLQKHLRYVLKD